MIAVLSATWGEIQRLSEDLVTEVKGIEAELQFRSGELYGQAAVLAETGVGIRRARAGTSYILQKFRPGLIVYTGLCGALDPKLNIGDIILGDSTTSLKLNETRTLTSQVPPVHAGCTTGPILSENRFVHTPGLKNELYLKSRALVVDMESWGALQAVEQSGTPLICVRAVSDASCDKLPDMGSIYGSSGSLVISKAFPYFLGNPGMLFPYLRFRFISSKVATNALHSYLKELITAVGQPRPER